MDKIRPININPFNYRYPLPAIISILHRISGVILFLIIPFALCLLDASLTEDGFERIAYYTSLLSVQLLLWLMLVPFCFHLVAGIRHLLMDMNLGVSLQGGKTSSIVVLVASFVCILLLGIWLW